MSACVYILRLQSGGLYVGCTKDIHKRYQDHLNGNACQTTLTDQPVSLEYSEDYESFSEARRREAQIKRWSRAKKEALISGDLEKLRILSKSRK
jgi:predicted GIY-YIG superfamily endonuclease